MNADPSAPDAPAAVGAPPAPGTPAAATARPGSGRAGAVGVPLAAESGRTAGGRDAAAVRARLASSVLYLCTDARERTGDLAEFADAVLAGGVDIVQLRDKGIEARRELAALTVLADACRRHGALLAVNDRADIAAVAGADVLHLGQDDLPVAAARRLLGDLPAIGRSTHDLAQARSGAAEDGADYFCVGPVWATPTKPGRPAVGLDLLRSVADARVRRPWFAIGGIDEANLGQVLAAGARRIVVVRAITAAEDPGAAAARLSARVRAAATGTEAAPG